MDYFAADRAAEDERLLAQSRLVDPATKRLLEAAGLAPGMRVLDLGSGAGNVARLAAELVGPNGAVVGVEKDPEAVELAQRHTSAPNVEFRVGDAQTLYGIEGGFDAVTGRLILLHLPDTVGALRAAAARVRPGGLVIMHECDLGYLWASPQPPLWSQARAWLLEAAEKAGIGTRLGPGAVQPVSRGRAAWATAAGRSGGRGRAGRAGLGLGQRRVGGGPTDGTGRCGHPGGSGTGDAGRTPTG